MDVLITISWGGERATTRLDERGAVRALKTALALRRALPISELRPSILVVVLHRWQDFFDGGSEALMVTISEGEL